jgi:hypothetical protein
MKTAFLIRGYRLNSTAADPEYDGLRDVIAAKGYRVVPADITWNRKTVSAFAKKFIELYEREKSEYSVVVGGSFGAMVALVSAPETMPDELILCSLSAYFSEDLGLYEEKYLLRRFGHRRVQDLKTLSADEFARRVNDGVTRTVLMHGEKEEISSSNLVDRVKDTASKLERVQVVRVPNAGHKNREPEYIAGLKKVLS